MKVGSPFRCTHCGAALTWSDTPVIECNYCHTKILMKDVGAPPGAGGRGKPDPAKFILAGALVIGVVIIGVRASKKDIGKAKATAAAVTPGGRN